MSDDRSFTIRLEQTSDYQFTVAFDDPKFADLLLDEPPPLGAGAGPNAARLVAAAVANCLSASLLFSVRKFKQDPGRVTAEATTRIARNEAGRFRISGVEVTIRMDAAGDAVAHLERSLAQFEEFCIVTQSVRQGIPVAVKVLDGTGKVVHGG